VSDNGLCTNVFLLLVMENIDTLPFGEMIRQFACNM